MKIEQQQVGTVTVISPVGALVDSDGESFTAALLDRLSAPNSRVVIAMQEVAYMDSMALEGMLDAADSLAERGQSLKLSDVQPACREILELTCLSERFSIFSGTQDAVRSFL